MKTLRWLVAALGGMAAVGLVAAHAPAAPPTDTTFTYQGTLDVGGSPANGNYSIDVKLWNAETGGMQIGGTQTFPNVAVSAGLFKIDVDFGANAFDNNGRWLEIVVNGTPLSPRQAVTRAPYAIQTRGIFVNDAGNVGIGTTNPTQGKVVAVSEPNGFGFVQTDGSTILGTRANSVGGWIGTQSSHYLILFRGGSAAIVLNSSGYSILNHTHFSDRVGIGTTAPNVPEASLQILGGPVWTTGSWTKAISTANGHAYELKAGSQRFGIGASDGFPFGSGITLFSTPDAGPTAVPTYILAATSTGNVGLGTIAPTFQLQLSTNSAAKPTSGSWTISSDRRLKKNINPIQGALEQLMQLHGVTFQWKDPASQGNMTGTYTGMIAQDVEKVFPEWIATDSNGFKTLTVIGFEGVVVEALRDLRAEKDAEIEALREENDELRSRLERLETMMEELAGK